MTETDTLPSVGERHFPELDTFAIHITDNAEGDNTPKTILLLGEQSLPGLVRVDA